MSSDHVTSTADRMPGLRGSLWLFRLVALLAIPTAVSDGSTDEFTAVLATIVAVTALIAAWVWRRMPTTMVERTEVAVLAFANLGVVAYLVYASLR